MGDGFFGKLKVLIGIEDIEDDELDEAVQQKPAERKLPESRTHFPPAASQPDVSAGKSQDQRVLPMANRVTTANQFSNQFKMLVIEPAGFEECPRLVDSLKAKKPVIINLEKVETDLARKIFDFLSGATYALNGNVQKVANNIFVFAPENVDVSVPIEPKNLNLIDKNNPWR